MTALIWPMTVTLPTNIPSTGMTAGAMASCMVKSSDTFRQNGPISTGEVTVLDERFRTDGQNYREEELKEIWNEYHGDNKIE